MPSPRVASATLFVQPEMERGHSPLLSIPPFKAEIFRASKIHQAFLSMVVFPQNLLSFRPAESLYRAANGGYLPDSARLRIRKEDIRIVQRTWEILISPAKWNRADDRKCPAVSCAV